MEDEKIYNLALKPTLVGEFVDVYEHANPVCEIADKGEQVVVIRTISDAEMVIESLTRFIKAMKEYDA